MKIMRRIFTFLGVLSLIASLFFFFMGFDYSSSDEAEETAIVDITKEEKIELVATASTKYNSSLERQNNIALAAESIDGTVLRPSATFSFNNVVGKRTKEKGYLPAATFIKDEEGEVDTIDSLGGGICQVSSTLHMAVKKLDAEDVKILERHPHSKRVTYCKEADEAMVDYETSDFKFKNNSKHKIKIEFEINDIEDSNAKMITCNIYSIS